MSLPDPLEPLLRREARRLRVDPRPQLQQAILAAIRQPEPSGALDAAAPLRSASWGWRLTGAGTVLAAAAGVALAVSLIQAPTAPAAPQVVVIREPQAAPAAAALSPVSVPTPPALELPTSQPLQQELDALASDLAQGGSLVLAAVPPAPRHS